MAAWASTLAVLVLVRAAGLSCAQRHRGTTFPTSKKTFIVIINKELLISETACLLLVLATLFISASHHQS